MELRYVVPPESEGMRLGIFLRTCGVTAGLIKSVKHVGQGFFCRWTVDTYRSDRSCRSMDHLCFAAGTCYQRDATADSFIHCI